MKCKFLKPVQIANPLFSVDEFEKQQRLNAGKPAGDRTEYPHSPSIDVEEGYELEHPQAWMHCCPGLMNAQPIAEPADEECKAKTLGWLQETRPQKLAQLKQMYEQRHKFKDATVRESIEQQAVAYGIVGSAGDPNEKLAATIANSNLKNTDDHGSSPKAPAKTADAK